MRKSLALVFPISALLFALDPSLAQEGSADQEPERVAPGQSSRGISVTTDGRILFHDEEIGRIPDAGAARASFSKPSPRRGLIYVNHEDTDHGGLQGSIIDPASGRLIVKSMLPEERIRGNGNATDVVQICEDISWSPEEDYAIVSECGEVIRSLVVADLANGRSRVLDVGSFERDSCDRQYLDVGTSPWVSATTLRVKVVLHKNPWAEENCPDDRDYPTYDLLVDASSLKVQPLGNATLNPQETRYVRATTRLNLRECPGTDNCAVMRTLNAETELQVLEEQGDWVHVRDTKVGDSGWVSSGYTVAVMPPPDSRGVLAGMSSLQKSLALLLLVCPLLLGSCVWLLKPASAITRMDACNGWLLEKKLGASTRTGFFARYWGRPVFWSAGLLIKGTEKIPDPFLRCGTRLAAYIYFTAFTIVATLVAAYVAITIVLAILVILVTVWILLKVLSSSDDSDDRTESYRSSAERRRSHSPDEDEDDERGKRELLLRAGFKGSRIFQKTGAFSEDEHGRIDDDGRIYRKTGPFSEEEVGRIDERGRIYSRTGPFSEDEAGRIDESGRVYEKSGSFSENEVGRVDEDGRLYRKTGLFSEDEIGRADREA